MRTAVIVAISVFVAFVRGSDARDYIPAPTVSSEVFASRIIKIYSAGDGDFRSFAFVVMWKNQEVVALPGQYFSDDARKCKVGETIYCLMQRWHQRIGDDTKRDMTFTFLSGPHDSLGDGPVTDPITLREAKRLDAVANEIEKRRLQREAVTKEAEAKVQR